MKLLILLVSLSFCFHQAISQDRFFDLNKEGMTELVSRLTSMAGNFKLDNTDSSKKNIISLVYFNQNDPAEPLNIQFEISQSIRKGIPKSNDAYSYTLRKIYGQYSAVAPLYKALIGRSFDYEAVQKAGKDRTEVTSNDHTHTVDLLQHKPGSGFWLLRTF